MVNWAEGLASQTQCCCRHLGGVTEHIYTRSHPLTNWENSLGTWYAIEIPKAASPRHPVSYCDISRGKSLNFLGSLHRRRRRDKYNGMRLFKQDRRQKKRRIRIVLSAWCSPQV